MMSPEPSIHDVAEMAGVSIATVSRVINKRDRVSPGTRQTVDRAINRLKYRPNTRARALSSRRTDNLGLVLPDFMGDYYGRLMEGVDEGARIAGLHLMVTKAKSGEDKRDAVERLLVEGRVDGAILMLDQPDEDLLDQITQVKGPLVVLDLDVGHRHLNNVLIDNRTGARDAADHLIHAHNLRNLIFVGGPENNIDTREREEGFRDALKSAGIAVYKNRFFFTDYDYEAGYKLAVHICSRLTKDKRWGVIAANDDLARGFMEALIRKGYRVPEDVAVIGYDDSRLADLTRPPLSSVQVPLNEVGRTAVKIIMDNIHNPAFRPTKIILKGTLVLRSSCGCPDNSRE